MKNISISILITTYNSRAVLRKSLEAFLNIRKQPFEYLICDDGSSDGTGLLIKEYAERFQVPVRHVFQDDNGWDVAGIRNKGALEAKGNYLIFIDCDCVPSKQFFENHEKLVTENFFVFGDRCHVDERHTEKFYNSWLIIFRYSLLGHLKKRILLLDAFSKKRSIALHDFQRDYHFYSNLCISCNFGVWREDFLKVGGFDEAYQKWWPEDTDIAVRLLNAGLKGTKVYRKGLVFHLDHPSRAQDGFDCDTLIQERLRDGVIVADSCIPRTRNLY